MSNAIIQNSDLEILYFSFENSVSLGNVKSHAKEKSKIFSVNNNLKSMKK